MPNPDFQLILLPFLEGLKDGAEHSMQYIHNELMKYVELSDEALKPIVKDRGEQEFEAGILLAKEHLQKAGLIENTNEDHIRITSLGKLVLNKRLNSLDVNYLRRFPGYSTSTSDQ